MAEPKTPSVRLVDFINIVFAVVIAQSFARYSDYILHPNLSWLVFLGLLAVWFTTILSWVRYHRSAIKWPYEDNPWFWLRFIGDFIIVASYAYLLYSLEAVRRGDLGPYLWGFSAIYFLYIVVGWSRIKEQRNREASNLPQLLVFFCIFLVFAILYRFLSRVVCESILRWLNWVFLFLPPILNGAFTKRWWSAR